MTLAALIRILLRWLGFRRNNDFRVKLEFENWTAWSHTSLYRQLRMCFMSSSLNITLGDTGTHTAVLVCGNTLDGTLALGVAITYASNNADVATVDATTGAITVVGVGSCTITGTGTRGAFTHMDSGEVFVALPDPNTGDFAVSLSLS